MRKFFAISAMGKDRPGIVAGVSKALFELGTNIEDTSMTILRGEFAMILIVSTGEDLTTSDFENRLKGLIEEMNLFLSVKKLSANEIEEKKIPQGTPYIISVIGTDKPGIVYRVTECLASRKINITDLKTKVITGEDAPVYTMIIEVDIPQGVDIALLGNELDKLGDKMAIDISIREIEIADL